MAIGFGEDWAQGLGMKAFESDFGDLEVGDC